MITRRGSAVEIQMLGANPLEDCKSQMLIPNGLACFLARECFCDADKLSLRRHLRPGATVAQVRLERVFQ